MSHQTLHNTLALSAPFVVTLVASAAALTLLGLAVSRSSRLSAVSRHLVLSVALISPLLAFLLASSPVAEMVRLSSTDSTVAASNITLSTATSEGPAERASELPCVLWTLWLFGVVLSSLVSLRQWRRWNGIAQQARPASDPRLLAVWKAATADLRRTPVLGISDVPTEPVVVGLMRPSVLLPSHYAESLDRAELDSVFAHELEHVRRRDNVTAALHQLLAAVFWFDPLHSVARRRLLSLRESACDERVLARGCGASSYIAALAKSCHATIESPAVACMSGFHIRERIESIMSYPSARNRFLPENLIRLATMGGALTALALFLVFTPLPSFAGTAGEAYRLDLHLRSGAGERVLAEVTVTAPDGELAMSSKVLLDARRPVTLTAAQDSRTLTVEVAPLSPSGSRATLEVTDKGTVVHRATRQAILPPRHLPAGAKPMAAGEWETGSAGDSDRYRKIEDGITLPQALTRVAPVYTAEARKERVAGMVVMQVRIDEAGIVRGTRVLKPLPFGLDQAAIDAVRQWTFAPALLDGKPVAVTMNITVSFRLDDDK